MIAITRALDQQQDEPVFIRRIRLHARRKVLWLRHLWSATVSTGDPAITIGHGEVDRILLGQPALRFAETEFYATNPEARQSIAAIREVDLAWSNDPQWLELRQRFGLSDADCDLLSLAVAAEVDPDLMRLYGYLADQATPSYASSFIASQLFLWPQGHTIDPNSALITWGMVEVIAGSGPPTYQADRAIAGWFVGGGLIDASLGAAVELHKRHTIRSLDILYLHELNEMLGFARAAGSQFIELELVAPEGGGKRTLATQFAARSGSDLLVADARSLLGGETPPALARDRTMRVIRNARLIGAMPYWHRADQIDVVLDPKWAGAGKEVIGIGRGVRHRRGPTPVTRRSIVLPHLTKQQRVLLWSRRSGATPPRPVVEWLLTPAEIVAAAQVVEVSREAVAESCRTIFDGTMRELVSPLACPFTWDDIVLSPGVRRHLYEFEAQARLRWEVYEDWGFGRLCALGRGVTALFAGPSGSGKTMAAQVLARSLGMDLYRVDLAGVMNKYIGETEKRLKQVFDACERANVVLLFDEADALFGQRTQVRDAHDRFANIEIDYLLQRMEQFDGIAILASNRKGDLDKAFVRRLRFIVDFTHPGTEERCMLWQKSLVQRSPSGELLLDNIDWQFLAERVVISAADIKLAALAGAFLARTEGGRIGMRHVLAACRRELAKQGIELRGGELLR